MHDDLFDGENECDLRVKLMKTSIKDAEALQWLRGPRHGQNEQQLLDGAEA